MDFIYKHKLRPNRLTTWNLKTKKKTTKSTPTTQIQESTSGAGREPISEKKSKNLQTDNPQHNSLQKVKKQQPLSQKPSKAWFTYMWP